MALIDEPPFCFPAGDGAGGYDVEVAQLVLARMGVTAVDTVFVTFADLLPGLAAGRWRMTTPLFITPERQRSVDFGRTAWALPDGLLVRTGETRRVPDYATIGGDATLRLAVIGGQVQAETALEAGVRESQLLLVATPEAAMAAVRAGQADAYASVALAHRGLLRRSPDSALAVVEFSAQRAAKGAYGFAKADAAFRTAFDDAFATLLLSGPHRIIMDRYGFTMAEVTGAPTAAGR